MRQLLFIINFQTLTALKNAIYKDRYIMLLKQCKAYLDQIEKFLLNCFRLCELIEHETEAYFKMDPDPFDDRHPGQYNHIQIFLLVT